jgi:hypothetical protein
MARRVVSPLAATARSLVSTLREARTPGPQLPAPRLPGPDDRGGNDDPAAPDDPRSAGDRVNAKANRADRLALLRRVLAIVFILSWASIAWVSYQTSHLQQCQEQVARVGNSPLVKSCGPLSLTDPPMLALLIVACVLILPDLSSIEIPGVIRLEREIEKQAIRQDELAGMVQRLDLAVHQQQQQHVSVVHNSQVALSVAELAQAVNNWDAKNKRFEEQELRDDADA